MRKLVIIVATIVLVGCASAKLLIPTQSDVDRVSSKFSDYSLAELNKGKALFENHCRNCHGIKDPTSRTEAQWTKIVPQMSKKVNSKEENALDANGEKTILRFLITMSTIKQSK